MSDDEENEPINCQIIVEVPRNGTQLDQLLRAIWTIQGLRLRSFNLVEDEFSVMFDIVKKWERDGCQHSR
jgi:hypothetical protein